MLLAVSTTMHAQMLAVKTDALADLAMMPNVGLELTTGNRTSMAAQVYTTFNIYGLNIRGVALQPEFRYWPISGAMNKLFIGASCLYSHYNLNREQTIEDPKTEAFKGDALGAGMSAGWVWPLTKYHWNIEASATLGFLYYEHKHTYTHDLVREETYNQKGIMFMPYHIGVSFCYIIHYRHEKDSKRRYH